MSQHRPLSIFLASILLSAAASAQISGLAFTTDAQGESQQVFDSPAAVYLAGGPRPGANCQAPGLPDGTYYFQVTDVSGLVLLSTDDVALRALTVQGGVISGVLPGGHPTTNGPCSSRIVRLAPFVPQAALDGECRVWVTRTDKYLAGQGLHGFLPEFSKADTFKVATAGALPPQSRIHGTIGYDVNGNGFYDTFGAGEVTIPGWKVRLSSATSSAIAYTDADGNYQFLRPLDSTPYTLDSIAPAPGYVGIVGGRWVPTSPAHAETVTEVPDVKVNFADLFLVPNPGLARSKGFWHNRHGRALLEQCDPEWREVIDGLCLRTNFSNPNGQDGTLYTVSLSAPFANAFQSLSDYLTDTSAHGVIAYILSVQYCAANLNKSCGPMSGLTIYSDRFGDGVLISFEDLAAVTLELLCDPRSANTGPHGDQEWRDHLMMCLNEWDTMNGSGSSIFSGTAERPNIPLIY
jgi:hypothetical protein